MPLEHEIPYLVILAVEENGLIQIETMGTGMSKQEAIDYFQETFGPTELNETGWILCQKHTDNGTAFILKSV